jgi:hypothetical protein
MSDGSREVAAWCHAKTENNLRAFQLSTWTAIGADSEKGADRALKVYML